MVVEFEYPQLGVTTANEMVIPAGKPVHLELRSVDVIHSFWLPRIAGKVDLIPGRANSMWIQAGDDFNQWQAKHNPEGSEMELQQSIKIISRTRFIIITTVSVLNIAVILMPECSFALT